MIPLSAALLPFLALWGLTALADPSWIAIEPDGAGRLLLSLSICLPLFVLVAPSGRGLSIRDWAAVTLASLASVLVVLHAGLAEPLVVDLDAGDAPGTDILLGASAVFLAALSIPAGLLLARSLAAERIAVFVLLGTVAAAAGQLLWFGLLQAVRGPHGADLWIESRTLIHSGVGAVAGLLAGARRDHHRAWAGALQSRAERLPARLPAALILLAATAVAGALRIHSATADTRRFAVERLDGYFLALSNLARAEQARLSYTELHRELDRARRALIGAASFDEELVAKLEEMLAALESPRRGEEAKRRFVDAARRVNRRLAEIGQDCFFEPHVLRKDASRPLRFVLRYRVEATSRYRSERGESVPVLRLRRLDRMLVDTPYTGLSYPGTATVLMDHVDDQALTTHAPLLASGSTRFRRSDGRFAATRARIRRDRRRALLAVLSRSGCADPDALAGLSSLARGWSPLAEASLARERLDAGALASFDVLVEALARQTEIHEARHALDGERGDRLPLLDELSAGPLAGDAAAEIRAYLTEVIDGPLGPHFALATIGELVAGEDARANAYLFAGITLLEGLWGSRIRRPNVEERDGPDGPRHVFLPIRKRSPGWLSYSRIWGAYEDLSDLEPQDLRARARKLFEDLFDEEYRSLRKLR